MSPPSIRRWLRWSHIVAGIVIGAYICSPLHADETATLVARLSLLPVLALTGTAMWQQGRFNRVLNRGRRDVGQEPATVRGPSGQAL